MYLRSYRIQEISLQSKLLYCIKNIKKFEKLASLFVKKDFYVTKERNTNEYKTNHYDSRNRVKIWRRNQTANLRWDQTEKSSWYSIHNAKEAGFNKVVFIICKDIFKEFEEIIGNRIKERIDVEYVF